MDDIVKRAIKEGITDIGQLTKQDIKLLNKAIKQGILQKSKNYQYPLPKNCYIPNYLKEIEK